MSVSNDKNGATGNHKGQRADKLYVAATHRPDREQSRRKLANTASAKATCKRRAWPQRQAGRPPE